MGLFDEIDETGPVSDDGKDRLFQTVKESSANSRKYLKLLAIVAVFVVVAVAVMWYLGQPGIGDKILAPKGLEQAVRDHFLVTEKRDATDITFYYCGTFYWARVGVEKRPDIKTNPIYLIDSYNARAAATSEATWTITATPVTSPDMDKPCS